MMQLTMLRIAADHPKTLDGSVGDFDKSVTRSLSEVLGKVLRRVVIRALDGEVADRAEFADQRLYVGGEVHLDFGVDSVFVSWAEND